MLTPAGFGGGPFLQNPYFFMFASLAKPDDDTELHWMKVPHTSPFFLTPLAYSQSCIPLFPGRKDAMYHGISRLVSLSPQGCRE